MLYQSFEELKATGKLPSFPGVGMQLLKMTKDDDCSAADIAATLQSDPALTGRILQLANSAAAGATHPVTTVNEAAVRLGISAVRSVALGFSLVSGNRTGRCQAFDFETYWSESMARGVAAQVLSRRFRVGVAAEVFVCGLLSRIGELALATAHPERYGEVLGASGGSRPSTQELADAEREVFGITHVEVARAVLNEWGLPEAFGRAMVALAEPVPEAESDRLDLDGILRVAVNFATAFLAQKDEPENPEEVERILARCDGWEEGEFADLWDEILSEWHHWGSLLQVATHEVPRFRQGEAPDPAAPAAAGGAIEPIGSRVLVAMAESQACSEIVTALQESGHQVVAVPDGDQALERALRETPDIVVGDSDLPGAEGFQLCQTLRRFEQGCSMFFLLLSGRDDFDWMVQAYEEGGIDDSLAKPVHLRMLQARVQAGERVIRLQQRVEADRKTMQAQVAELAVLTRKLRHAALTDALTGMPNRRCGMDSIQKRWDAARESGEPFSVVMLDIDHFKKVNDTYGHDVGDVVLCSVGRALTAASRSSDLVCRMGGEEFLMLLPGADAQKAALVADRVRQSVAARSIRAAATEVRVTISLGAAEMSDRMTNHQDLIKAADQALYKAKETGRNKVVVVRPKQPAAT